MSRIADIIADANGPTLSVEFFPPKTPAGDATLNRTIDELRTLSPSFVSVTYGAGGSTRERTRDLVVDINATEGYPAMAHLTCVGHTKNELNELIDDYSASGVDNILALGGDPPADGSPVPGDFTYAIELVELVRERAPHMSVAVAAHPECHPRSIDIAEDRRHLARKLAAADFALTQFFFDADNYFRMIDELEARPEGCRTPILPGIMPLTNLAGIERMSKMSGTTFPVETAARLEAASEADRLKMVVEEAALLSQALLDGGAPGLHLYGLNRSETVLGIVKALGLDSQPRD
ncbi:MAG: methylenetetrahydrofolate reductase [Microthrixaceae bacterium]